MNVWQRLFLKEMVERIDPKGVEDEEESSMEDIRECLLELYK